MTLYFGCGIHEAGDSLETNCPICTREAHDRHVRSAGTTSELRKGDLTVEAYLDGSFEIQLKGYGRLRVFGYDVEAQAMNLIDLLQAYLLVRKTNHFRVKDISE